jgi:8-oxo-dGTP diphosphatase
MIYVAGAFFNESLTQVALIKKDRPEWQKGFFNLIGGKVENKETPREAMAREFEEEASLKTLPSDWNVFLTLHINGNLVYFLYNKGQLDSVKTTTDEKVEIHYVDHLPVNVIDNLNWIIPLALYSNRIYPVDIWYQPEKIRS